MIIKHNLSAMNAQRQYGIVVDSVDKSIEKLSSGYRINKAADDAAGLSVSEKMRKQIRGLKQGVDNTEDGVSLCQVADGALAEVADMVHRISELAIKSANGTNSDNDRQYIQDEVSQLLKEIDRISDTTKFNEIKLFSVENTELSYKVEQASSEKNTQITLSQDEIVNKLLAGNYNMISKSFVTLRGVELSAQTYNAIMASLSTCMIGIDLYEKIDNGLIDYDGTRGQNTVKLHEYAVQIFKNAKYDDTKWSNYQGEIDNAISLLEGYSTALTNNLAESVSNQATQMLLNIITANDYVGKTMHGVADVLGWKARLNHTVQGADTAIIYYSNRTLNQFATSIGDSLLTEKLNNNVQQVLRDDWSTAPHLYRCEGDVEVSEICEAYNYLLNARDSEVVYEKSDQLVYSEKNIWIQSGCEAHDGIMLKIDGMNTSILGIAAIDVSTIEGAEIAIDATESALEKVMRNRSIIGAQQNRLEHTIKNENNIIENTTSAESQIRDTDMAEEMVDYSNNNILQQAGQSMLAQANQSNQGVLSLIQ